MSSFVSTPPATLGSNCQYFTGQSCSRQCEVIKSRRGQHQKRTACTGSMKGPSFSRREFLRFLTATAATAVTGARLKPEEARAITGLHVFPLREPLSNTYYLMRACESHADAAQITAVNPIDRLSLAKLGLTREGATTAQRAADALSEAGVSDDSWIWSSITISAFETAEILASKLRVRRDHIVPEFAFLDARGVGAMDGLPMEEVSGILEENDRRDPSWRPQHGEDGTPNDSAQDVFVRITQLISKLETQYIAESIIIVAPDSDNLSVWQAAVTGRSLTEHPSMRFDIGEVRRVREVVVDAYDQVVEPPQCETIFKPMKA